MKENNKIDSQIPFVRAKCFGNTQKKNEIFWCVLRTGDVLFSVENLMKSCRDLECEL